MNGLTPRSVAYWKNPRPPIDRAAVRYFIYRLHDEAGTPIYIGRSSDPTKRIRSHINSASHPDASLNRSREWVFDVRSVSMLGPYTWDDACRVERREIEAHQPRGNRMFTKAHGWHGNMHLGATS